MREHPLSQLAAWLDADLLGDPSVLVGPQVVIDSRQVRPGALFVALPGERVDGHDFVAAAATAGAAAAVVARQLEVDLPQLVVSDPAQALAALARAIVAEARDAGLITVGITGSSGKTSTKDLLSQVLAVNGPTVAPQGSFNNEIGVPLTAISIDPGTRYLVSEMGARSEGDIRWLCGIVPPRIGVVVNVGQAHLGEFGSVEAIAEAKGELVEALPQDGWAVLNAEDPLVIAMSTRTRARLATFAVDTQPVLGELRVWAEQVELDALGRPAFQLVATGIVAGRSSVSLTVSGRHQVGNALAAAAVGLTLGMELEVVASALNGASARSRWRMELASSPDGVLVVNDAYNANPDSMAAALRTLSGLRRDGGRLLAVLGDMLELGPDSAQHHRRIGGLLQELGIDELIAVGNFAEDMVESAKASGVAAVAVADRQQAAQRAAAWLCAGDVVLVKASRGLALESVAEALLAPRELGGREA